MLRYALILDTETTGLDPAVHKCIEVACILFDLALATPLSSFSSLIRAETNEAESINRIPAAALLESSPADIVWHRVTRLASGCDIVLAHGAEFDRSFVPAACLSAVPWACTCYHVEWPYGKYGDGLVKLALAHGLGVVQAHRAASDCDMLSRLLTRVHEMQANPENSNEATPLIPRIERALRPRVKLRALVSYDDNQLAKDAGFRWDPDNRRWWREVFAEDPRAFAFETRVF